MSLSRIQSRLGTLLDLIKKGSATPEEKLSALRTEIEDIRAMVHQELVEEPEDLSGPDISTLDSYQNILAVVRQSNVNSFKTYYDQDYFDSLSEKSQTLLGKALLEFCAEQGIKPLQLWSNYGTR